MLRLGVGGVVEASKIFQETGECFTKKGTSKPVVELEKSLS